MKPATTEDVFDLMDSCFTSAALGAAMELGLFWLLAEQPLDVEGVAQALGIPRSRCQYWLQLLGSVGLIEQVSNGYAPSSTARTAILDAYSQESWAFLAQEVRQRFPAVRNLAQHIHEPVLVQRQRGRMEQQWRYGLPARSGRKPRRSVRLLSLQQGSSHDAEQMV